MKYFFDQQDWKLILFHCVLEIQRFINSYPLHLSIITPDKYILHSLRTEVQNILPPIKNRKHRSCLCIILQLLVMVYAGKFACIVMFIPNTYLHVPYI